MSHTPGPWSVQGPYGASHGREWEISTEDGHGVWTARCQNASDAALVSAAPDLLEALKKATNFYCKDWCSVSHTPSCDKFRAAIAKAEGL